MISSACRQEITWCAISKLINEIWVLDKIHEIWYHGILSRVNLGNKCWNILNEPELIVGSCVQTLRSVSEIFPSFFSFLFQLCNWSLGTWTHTTFCHQARISTLHASRHQKHPSRPIFEMIFSATAENAAELKFYFSNQAAVSEKW